jgi:fumarate hydratase subunit beta
LNWNENTKAAHEPVYLSTPLADRVVERLRVGDRVYLSGTIYSARDTAHLLLVQAIHDGKPLPIDVAHQVIYYMGPTPAKPGQPVGAAGPTTSSRMDPYAPALLAKGLKGMIGKGPRAGRVKEAIVRHRAVYFVAIGGAGALLAKSILSAEIVAFPRLGPEALRRLEVKDMPLIVANDMHGGDLFEQGIEKYAISEETLAAEVREAHAVPE